MGMHVVVMAGGAGVRFWPRSRTARPKQLLPIIGSESMLRQTLRRVSPLNPESLMVITNAQQGESVREDLLCLGAELGDRLRLVVEPAAKNTAPALALGAALLAREDSGGSMLVLPADHHIGRPGDFRALLLAAEEAARTGALVTLGIRPTRPATGYGYLELGRPAAPAHGVPVHVVRSFKEKPDRVLAERYLASGRYLWNSGMFIWQIKSFLEALARHMPDLHGAAEMVRRAESDSARARAVDEMFRDTVSESVDYGVMEKHEHVLVLPAEIDWSDLGGWDSLARESPPNFGSNTVLGDARAIGCRDCFVQAGSRFVGVVGATELVVVETEDAVLVCPRDRAQDVKRLVAELERAGRDELL